MTAATDTGPLALPGATSSTRWVQLGLGLIAMMSISSPQYVWTLFTKPYQDALHVPLSAVQVTLTILIVVQTFFSPAQGFLVDKFGPKLLIATGCVLSGLGWIAAAYATTLTSLYLTYGLLWAMSRAVLKFAQQACSVSEPMRPWRAVQGLG